MYRKRLLKFSVITALCVLSIVGCGKKETNNDENNNTTVTTTVTPTDAVMREEPSLSKEAKKLTQFAELEKRRSDCGNRSQRFRNLETSIIS